MTISSWKVLGIRPADRAFRVTVNLEGDLLPGWIDCFADANEGELEATVHEASHNIVLFIPSDPQTATKQALEQCILEANEAFATRYEQKEADERLCQEYEAELNGH